VTLWAQVVAINPTQGLSWARLGQARYHVGQYREAIPAFEKTIELGAFPDLLEHEYNYRWRPAYDIARCYALLGEHEHALAWLERSLALGYRNRAAIHHDDDLRSLRDDRRFQDLAGLADATLLERDAGWRHDLLFLAEEIKRIHYDPFRHIAEDAFDHLVQQQHDAIPTLTDDQIIVGIMRLVQTLGDGHSTVALWELGERLPDAPVEFYLFTEGLFVTAAAPAYRDVIGAQVVALGDHPVEQVIMALTEIISRDNPMWIQQCAPGLMRKPRVLHAMGLIPDGSTLPITIRDGNGAIRTIHIEASHGPFPDPLPADWPAVVKQSGGPLPLYLKEGGHYWFEYLADEKVLYFHYRTVRDHPDEPFDQFCDRLFTSLNTSQVDKLVIDMRRNGGGNTFLHMPLFRGIARSEKLRQGTTLFVIIGRQTFSAAMNLVTYLESRCFEWGIPLVFVGEPTGSSPNFVGETVIVRLPYSSLPVSISDLYWQTSWPEDARIWLPPQLYTPPTFAALRTGTDPALHAIFRYHVAGGVDDKGSPSPPTA
jgi:hypothetical protein